MPLVGFQCWLWCTVLHYRVLSTVLSKYKRMSFWAQLNTTYWKLKNMGPNPTQPKPCPCLVRVIALNKQTGLWTVQESLQPEDRHLRRDVVKSMPHNKTRTIHTWDDVNGAWRQVALIAASAVVAVAVHDGAIKHYNYDNQITTRVDMESYRLPLFHSTCRSSYGRFGRLVVSWWQCKVCTTNVLSSTRYNACTYYEIERSTGYL